MASGPHFGKFSKAEIWQRDRRDEKQATQVAVPVGEISSGPPIRLALLAQGKPASLACQFGQAP